MILRACARLVWMSGSYPGNVLRRVGRHPPEPTGRRLHRPTDLALACGNDVDERLAVEAERHRPPQIGIVEGRHIPVDDQIAADVGGEYLADRLRRLVFDVLQL